MNDITDSAPHVAALPMHSDHAAPATLSDAITGATVPPTPPTVTKEARVSSIIDTAGNAVVVNGNEVYAATNLSPAVIGALVLIGLRSTLITSANRSETYRDLAGGKVPGRAPAKAKELDVWRKAVAQVVAEFRAKDKGAKKGTPEFADILTATTTEAAGMTTEKLRAAKANPAVVAAHAKLTGSAGDVSGLLG